MTTVPSTTELLKYYNETIEKYSKQLQDILKNKKISIEIIEKVCDNYYIIIDSYQRCCKHIRYKYKTKQLCKEDINEICKVYINFFEEGTSQENIKKHSMLDYAEYIENLKVDIENTKKNAIVIINKYGNNNIIVNILLKFLKYIEYENEEICNKLRYKYENNELSHMEILNILTLEKCISGKIIPN
jgi:hypothetical protein